MSHVRARVARGSGANVSRGCASRWPLKSEQWRQAWAYLLRLRWICGLEFVHALIQFDRKEPRRLIVFLHERDLSDLGQIERREQLLHPSRLIVREEAPIRLKPSPLPLPITRELEQISRDVDHILGHRNVRFSGQSPVVSRHRRLVSLITESIRRP